MPTPSAPPSCTLVLLDGALQHLPADLFLSSTDACILVTGSSRVQMALAPLSMPGARVIWTDVRSSASLRSLRAQVEGGGGLDRLVVIGGQHADPSGFAHLSMILTLLPVLRRARGAEILLCLAQSPAAQSVRAFLDRLQPALSLANVRVRWNESAPA